MESTRSEERAALADIETGVVRGCRVETAPVRSLLRVLERPRLAWASPTETIAAGGATRTIIASGPDRFERVRQDGVALFERLRTVDAIPQGGRPRLLGGFAFTDTHTEPGEKEPWHGYPAAQFVLPAVQLSLTSDGAWLTTTAVGEGGEHRATERLERWRGRVEALPEFQPGRAPGVREKQYSPSREDWAETTTDVINRIREGDLRKVVLAQALSVSLREPPDVVDILANLGRSYPGCHRFLFEPPTGNTFFGATPERLVRLRDETIDTEALAGSIGRGETTAEDKWLAQQLFDSEKNNHEHDLVVEAIRDQLDGLTGAIRTGERTVRKLANVQHLQTPIRATATEEEHVLRLVEALHPTPAVGGLPPDDALRTIRESETFDRGWYAAPIGWFDAAGDGTFAVGIRSGVVEGTSATLFAGGGIVTDSDPDEEWDELQLKYRPVLDELA